MESNKSGSSLFDVVNSNEDDLSFCKSKRQLRKGSLVNFELFFCVRRPLPLLMLD